MKFNEILKQIYIESGITSDDDVGIYQVKVLLDDSKDSQEYQMEIYLICPKNLTVPNEYIERYDNPSPVPYIHSIN